MKLTKFGNGISYNKSAGYIQGNGQVAISLAPNTPYNAITLEGEITISSIPDTEIQVAPLFYVKGSDGDNDMLFGFRAPSFNTGDAADGKLSLFYKKSKNTIEPITAGSESIKINHRYKFTLTLNSLNNIFFYMFDNDSYLYSLSEGLSKYSSLYNPKEIIINCQDFFTFNVNTCKLSEDSGVTKVLLADLIKPIESTGSTNAEFTAAITIDQTYDASSSNAQSGKAVAQAVAAAGSSKSDCFVRTFTTQLSNWTNTTDSTIAATYPKQATNSLELLTIPYKSTNKVSAYAVFSAADAMSGKYAPFAKVVSENRNPNQGVQITIYATETPAAGNQPTLDVTVFLEYGA